MAHRIRLRKPWSRWIEMRPSTGSGSPSAEYVEVRRDERVDVPELVDDAAAGNQDDPSLRQNEYRVTYQRRFNRPSGLGEDRVRLAITRYQAQHLTVDMNAHPLVSLSGHPDAEVVNHFDLTEHLLEHNELTLTLESRSSRPRITGEVNLMIHPNE